jgi:hypothetical protein
MKMTKAIREFIEEQVTERAESASNTRLTELREAANAARERWIDALGAARKEFDAKLAELGAAHGFVYIDYSGKPANPQISGFSCADGRYLPEVKAYHEYKAQLDSKRARAIKDIIVSMELGGTKKELMEMIAALEF